MDEARRVLDRLDRIESLQRGPVAPRDLLGEVRALLRDVEAWVRSDPAAAGRTEEAIGRVRDAFERGETAAPSTLSGRPLIPG